MAYRFTAASEIGRRRIGKALEAALLSLLPEANLTSLADLCGLDKAGEPGISRSLLSQVLAGGRRLTPDVAGRLAKRLHVSSERLYDHIIHQLIDTIQAEEQEQSQRIWTGDAYLDVVEKWISTLKEGDTYWLISSEQPLEWSSTAFMDSLLYAASKGARINYVLLDLKAYETQSLSPTAVALMTMQLAGGIRDASRSFMFWREHVLLRRAETVPERWPNITKSSIDNCFSLRVVSLPEDAIFFAPGVKYVLLQSESSDASRSREAWVEIAMASAGVSEEMPRAFVQVPQHIADLLLGWAGSLPKQPEH